MDVFKEIFKTRGRLNRSLHIKYQLIWIVLVALAGTTGSALASFMGNDEQNITAFLFYLGLVGSSMLMVRRLHDINLSGFFILAIFVPVLGIFFWIYLFFAPGQVGSNQYGEEPLEE